MTTSRLEAFSDAVIAIIMTIMVLELKPPTHATFAALKHENVLPHFLAYALSFAVLGIYWNNHHHLLFATERVNGRILWSNLNLLFWLSLFPFMTAWVGGSHFSRDATVSYGVALLLAAFAYYLLQTAILHEHGPDSKLRAALGSDIKGKASPILYVAGIILAFFDRWVAMGIYVFVALMWLVPDKRIERMLQS